MLQNRCLASSSRCVAAREVVRGATAGLARDASKPRVRARAYSSGEYEHPDCSGASLAPLQSQDSAALQQHQEIAVDGVVYVTFWLKYQAEFGQRICVVGNCVGLGMWQHKAAPELQWNDGHMWSVAVEVPAGQVLEYKYVVMQPDGLTALHWQSGNNAVLALMPDDEEIEILDNWYDPASSMIAPNGRPRTTRSDRLALWANQMSGSVGQLKGELRATRMSVFEAQQGMKDALEQVKHTQDCLSDQVEENQKMAEQVLTMQEKNRKMRLQLIESQTLFKEVMAEARAIILSTVETPEDSDDELMLLSDMGFGSPRIAAEATASESEYEYEDAVTASDVEESGPEEAEELLSDDVQLYSERAARHPSEAQLARHEPEDIAFREPEVQAQRPSEQVQQEAEPAQEWGVGAGAVQGSHAATPVPQEVHTHGDTHVQGHSPEDSGNGAGVISLADRGQPRLTSALQAARRKVAVNRDTAFRRTTLDLRSEPHAVAPQMAADRNEATPSRVTMPVNDFNEPPPPPAAAQQRGVPPPVVTNSDPAPSTPLTVRWTPSPHVTPKNGYAPRRTSRRAPITMVPMPEPEHAAPAVATAAVAAATGSSALSDADTASYGPYETSPVGVDEETAAQVNAANTAASLKKMLHSKSKALPAAEAAGALLEAQVKLEAGLDGGSSNEDLEWLTDQAESLLSVFEQLEDDVFEAQQAVGRVISEA